MNPAESKITLLDAVTEYDAEPIANTNASNPSIDYNPNHENVVTLEITIEKTSDNSIPSSVQLAILGCSDPITLSTTTGNLFCLTASKYVSLCRCCWSTN